MKAGTEWGVFRRELILPDYEGRYRGLRMIEKVLSLLSDQEAMLPQGDRLSRMITEAEAGSGTDKTELFEDELETVQAALKTPEKPGKS